MFRARRTSVIIQTLTRLTGPVKRAPAWLLHPSVRSYVLSADLRRETLVLYRELRLSGFPGIKPADCLRARTQTLFHKRFFFEQSW